MRLKTMDWKKSAWITLASAGLVIAGCSGSSSNSKETPAASTAAAASPTSAQTQKPVETRAPVTFTLNNENPNINWDNPVAKEITKRTGVTVKWDITPKEKEKLTVWLASGDYPDLLNTWPEDLAKFSKAGALHDLTDLIPKHAPNIMKAFNNDLSSLKDPGDGKIYTISEPPVKEKKRADEMGWVHIQFNVLKEAGYPQIKSLDDVYKVISEYVKKHPEIKDPDGKMQKTIGFATFGGENQLTNQLEGPSRDFLGLPKNTGFYAVDDQLNARLRFFEKGYTDFLKFLNKLNREGLFDPESIVQTKGQLDAKCGTGRVLALNGAPWVVGTCNTALIQAGMADRQFAHFEVMLPGNQKIFNKAEAVTKALAITKRVKDPVRALQFIDDMFKLENQILVGWGIEGDYYEVKNGKRVPKPEFIARFNKERHDPLGLSYPPVFLTPRFGAILSDGGHSNFEWTPEFVQSGYTQETKDFLAKYNVQTWEQLMIPAAKTINVQFPTPPQAARDIQGKIVPEWNKAATKLVLEKDAAKLDAIWKEFEDTAKKLGLDELNKLATEHVKASNKK